MSALSNMLAVVRNAFRGSGSKAPAISPSEFTEECVAALRSAAPALEIRVVNDLELSVTPPNDTAKTFLLRNAYASYLQNRSDKAEVIARYVAVQIETVESENRPIDPTRLVPIIKDADWLERNRAALMGRGASSLAEMITDEFCEGLCIIYAEDQPRSIRFPDRSLLEGCGLKLDNLRTLACANLQRLLPSIQVEGGDGVYVVRADGNYEASLLLIDSLWNRGTFNVRGGIVAAIPRRNELLVTGSEDAEGLRKVREYVDDAFSHGAYHISSRLFVYRDYRFAPFE